MKSALIVTLSLLVIGGCDSKVGNVSLRLLRSPLDQERPLEGLATSLRVTVEGPDGRTGPKTAPLTEASATLRGIPVGRDKVIIVEGLDPDGVPVSRGRSAPVEIGEGSTSIELFIGRLERFSRTPEGAGDLPRGMNEARGFHSATLLPDGGVLLAGGSTNDWRPERSTAPDATRSVEVLDGNSLRFRVIDCSELGRCLSSPRLEHTATVLPAGSVLIAAGSDGSGTDEHVLDSTELFSEDRFFEGPTLDIARSEHASAARNDQVALVGGRSRASGLTNSVEAYQQRTVSQLPQLARARRSFTLTVLPDGALVVTGGLDQNDRPLASTEILGQGSGTWRDGPDLVSARGYHSATLLPDGSLLLVGGLSHDGLASNSIERYRADDRSEIVAQLRSARWYHSTTALRDGRLLVVGGFAANRNGSPTGTYEQIDIGASGLVSVRQAGRLGSPRAGHSATLLLSGWLLVAGGVSEGLAPDAATTKALDTAEIFIY